MTRTQDELIDEADAYARAFGVSIREAMDAIKAEEELERHARESHTKNPALTYEQASAEFLRTPQGAELYARANPRPRAKTKAVQANPRRLYLARAALCQAIPSDRRTKVFEAQIVDEALRLFIDVLADDETPARTSLISAFRV